MIETINEGLSDTAPQFILDNENIAELPKTELPEVGLVTKSIAQKNARTFTVFINRGLGGLGNWIGKKPSANYKLDAQETVIFEESLSDFIFHNGLSSLSPNLIFFMTVLMIVAPKFGAMYTDWRDGATPPPVPPPPPAKKENPSGESKSTKTEAVSWTAETAAAFSKTLPKPSSKEESLKIEEIGLQRGAFKLSDLGGGKIAYFYDIRNDRIKNGKHENTKNGFPSKWFEKLLLELESSKVPESQKTAVLKNYVKNVHKEFDITTAEVNSIRNKAGV